MSYHKGSSWRKNTVPPSSLKVLRGRRSGKGIARNVWVILKRQDLRKHLSTQQKARGMLTGAPPVHLRLMWCRLPLPLVHEAVPPFQSSNPHQWRRALRSNPQIAITRPPSTPSTPSPLQPKPSSQPSPPTKSPSRSNTTSLIH